MTNSEGKHAAASLRPAALAGSVCAAVAILSTQALPGCGSATGNIPGRCQPAANSGRVAAASDGAGPWKIEFGSGSTSGGGNIDIKCFSKDQNFEVVFAASVKDSTEQLKSGVALALQCSGGISVANTSETNTDSCGVAILRGVAKCPSEGRANSGSCFAVSGPLFSKPVNVNIEHLVPTPTPTQPIIIQFPTAAPT